MTNQVKKKSRSSTVRNDRAGADAESSPLTFFDAFTQIGPRAGKHPSHAWKLAELLEEMEHCSISAALVASTMTVRYDLMHSNRELSDRLEGSDRLFPIWNVMPHQTGEFPAPPELDRAMGEGNVRAVTLHPRINAWDWLAEHSRVLLAWLESRRMLTVVNRAEFGAYSELGSFLSRYPSLPVLLIGASWMEQRYVLPLMSTHENLHLGFDHFQIHYGLEDLVAMGMENRLLFTSNAPVMAMGAHRCYVDYADLPRNIRSKIASENLFRLLGNSNPLRTVDNQDEDVLMAAARRGCPLPVSVVDMHMHVLHEGLHGAGGAYRMSRGGPSGIFSMLERLGYVGGGLMSWNGTMGGDSHAGNDCVRRALDAAPSGYWGLASFDPVHYTASDLERMIPQVYSDKRFIGMKPYFSYGVEYHHRSYDVWWRYGNQHSLYGGMHRTRNDFDEVEKLALKYPRIRWVVYHCGSDYHTADQAIEVMRKYSNVYAEITFTSVTSGIVDHLAKHAGPDRILYGSDLPMRDPRQQLGWVIFSRISLLEKAKLLGLNAFQVIRPCLSRMPAYNRPKGQFEI